MNTLFQKFWEIAGSANLRVKVLGIVIGVVILLGLFITVQLRLVLADTLRQELNFQGHAISEATAEQAGRLLADDNLESLRFLLHEKQLHYSSGEHNTLVSFIQVEDSAGEIIERAADSDYVEGEAVSEFTAPLDNNLGMVRLGLSERLIGMTVNTVTTQIIEITLIMVGIGFSAAIFLTWILTRPILNLVQATQAVAQGDFSKRVPRWANDEIGDLAEAFNVMTAALAKADRERSNYIQGIIRAQEDERKRIARELHDSTSQSLTSLLVGLRNLEESTDPQTSRQRIEEIRRIVNHTLSEVHTLAWQLRPSVLDDLGLIAAIERLVADFQQRNPIVVDFVARGIDDRLPMGIEAVVYRIVQEGLTNIARHSKASNASVLLEQRSGKIRLIIEDDGVGFDPSQLQYGEKNLGVQGIRERANLLNGKLTIESQPGQGTSLFVEIPTVLKSLETGSV